MKTPKRDYKTPANQLAQDIEPDFFEGDYNAQAARWKRKNRIRQLKATIARQNKEYERLWESFSHMSKRCCELYDTLVYKHPGEIPIHLTPGELLEACHALKRQIRFTTTEQRANNESAVKKLESAYGISTMKQP